MTKWKWILGGAVAAVVLLVAAVYIVLLSYNYNSLKPEIERAVKEGTGRKLTLAGDISLKIGFTPALVVKDVRFENASWGSRPELAMIKRFEIEVKLLPLLSHLIELKRVVLIEPDILLETDRSGKSNLAFETPKKEAPSRPTDNKWKLTGLILNDLQIDKGRVTYIDRELKKTYVVTVQTLRASSAGSESPTKLGLKGTYNNNPFEVNGTLCPLTAFINPGRDWPLSMTVKADNVTMTLDGTVRDPLARRGIRLDFTLKCQDLGTFKLIPGGLGGVTGPLNVSGLVSDPAPEVYSFSKLNVVQGESDLSGSAEVNLAEHPPKLTAALTAKKLDLRPYTKQKEAPKAAKSDRVFSETPLSLDVLNDINVDVKLRAAQVILPNRSFSNLDIGVLLKDGSFTAKPFSAGLGQGSINGYVTLQSQGKTALLALALKINKADISYLTKDVKAAEKVKGSFDADIDIRGGGASVAGLMGGLNGKVVLVMGKGAIDNKYLDLVGGDLSSSIFRLINPFRKETEHTVINCCVAGFSIKDGVATATSLVFNTDRMVVVGEGDINLKTERLNLSLKPVPKEGVGTGITGKFNISLSELTRPFKLGGTLAHPSLAIDPTQTAIALGRAIGGVALFGPAGIASALVGSSSSDENSCSAAIEAAKKGVKAKKSIGGEVSEGAEKIIKGVGKGLNKLFGR